jgi:CheY-like chemotaxis protein
MDGLTLARQIMQDPRWAALPLVALSSTDSTETGAPLTASGFACALRKPMQPSLLKRCLERVLTRAAQASADSLVTTDPPTMPRLATNTRILLVEDNPVNREVCLAMLDLLGCHADSAIDGTEAVEAVCRTPFDLILMDCQMPGMNGFDATAAIRRWEATMPDRRRTPIIALTANAMEGDRDRCLAAGMDDYLTKPFSANQLGDILAQWLPPQETPSSPTLQTTLAQVSTPLHLTAPPAGASLPPSSTEYPVPPTSNSLVDFSAWEPINMMARSGRPSLLAKLLTAYLADARPLVEQIREAVAQANSATLTAAAHRLKSSSAVLGAMTVAALCKDLEACGRTEQIKDAQPLVPRLERDFEAVCAIFQQERHKEQAA